MTRVALGSDVIAVLNDPGSPTEASCFGNKIAGMRLVANDVDGLTLQTTVNETFGVR